MNTSGMALASFDFSSIAFGYKALDVVTRANGASVLEASPSGNGRFLIICSGPSDALQAVVNQLRSEFDGAMPEVLVDHALVSGGVEPMKEAIYSLAQVALDDSLVVVECETVSGLLAVAEHMLEIHQMKAIELKIHRGGASGGYGFFTGESAKAAVGAEDARASLRKTLRKGHVELIDRPSNAFREFFNFSGEA